MFTAIVTFFGPVAKAIVGALASKALPWILAAVIAGGGLLWLEAIKSRAYERGAAAERTRAAEVQKKRSEEAAVKGEAYRRMPRTQLDEALRKRCLEYGGAECGK